MLRLQLLLLAAARAHACSLLPPPLAADVLLKVTLARCDSHGLQQWLLRRPFASALPVQPMLVLPIKDPPPLGIDLTFRRKPTMDKSSSEGGLRFAVSAPGDGEAGVVDGDGILLVTRVSSGQSIGKGFSERVLIEMLLRELQRLPGEVGAVQAVLRPDSNALSGPLR
uniref:PDZ domain-containing protein n=1 Tax=Coccolithus braarudii TaxID=221442 RepID=A0A7S0L9D0_9EUKA|mmetsp:Transcript_26695/g.57646  ORF Transcript_26695/g.57646 Transcript_26695/m.57646 type:complete len:168 (+) Transcript_26695:268-771(+)